MKTYKVPDVSLFGIKKLDDQHQELFDILDGFNAIGDPGSTAEIDRLFERLQGLLVRHFADQEQLIAETGYSKLREHRGHHRKLLEEVATIRQRVADRGRILVYDTHQSLDKVLRHMLISDGSFNSYLKAIGYSEPKVRDPGLLAPMAEGRPGTALPN